MVGALYFVYAARASQHGVPPLVGVSHYPPLDFAILAEVGYGHMIVLKGPLPLALAELEAQRAAERMRAMLGGAPAAPGGAWTDVTGSTRFQPREPRPVAGGSLLGRWPWLPLHFGSVLRGFNRRDRQRGPSGWNRRAMSGPAGPCSGTTGRGTWTPAVAVRDVGSVETPAQEDLDAIREALEGRILFDHEIRRALQERGHPVPGPLEDALQVLTVRGLVGRAPSVIIDRFGIATCVRCGGHDIVEASCASCGSDECLRCVECASMGEARSCRPLYYAPGPPRVRQDQPGTDPRHGLESAERPEDLSPPPSSGVQGGKIALPFGLTKAQQDASRFLASFVTGDGPSECLVYAVCGAGKTEVCLEAVDLALRQGGRVLFAVPRSDVVAEVAPRVSTALPHARVVALRGASRERYRAADVVVATTHQTLRFYQAFDLVVLDEADAFPFRGSRMLRHALRRATVPHGKTIYMTATPDQSLLTAADQGRVALTRISARHHGRPLPVPAIVTVALPPVDERGALSRPPQPPPSSGNPHAAGLPSEAVATIEASLRAGHRVFVFVPTVGLAERVCNALEISLVSPAPAASPDSAPLVARPRVAFVHSRHPERDQLREAFKQGRIDVLVTTTIMERGINVPMADVVVLYADFDRVFDAGTLVQMAGRAGRSGEYPCARVHFVAERVSPAMRAAIASIRAMNEHAAAAGYLQKGSDPCL